MNKQRTVRVNPDIFSGVTGLAFLLMLTLWIIAPSSFNEFTVDHVFIMFVAIGGIGICSSFSAIFLKIRMEKQQK